MSGLGEPERAAIALVARRFSAIWEEADGDSPDAYLTVAGKPVAVEVAAIKPGLVEPTKPRLRFDRVALGLVGRLQAALSAFVPDGEAIVVTVTAPLGCQRRPRPNWKARSATVSPADRRSWRSATRSAEIRSGFAL